MLKYLAFLQPLAFLLAASLPASAQIRVSEIMYHPASENSAEEYIELLNTSTTNDALAGWHISGGIDFVFGAEMLSPGGFLVVAAKVIQFQAKYPEVTNVTGDWHGTLGSGSWQKLVDVPSQPIARTMTIADSASLSSSERYYRLVTPAIP